MYHYYLLRRRLVQCLLCSPFVSDALWNYLNRPGHSMQLTAGYRAPTYDAGYVVDANDGYFVDDL